MKDEQKYAHLNEKFHKELTELDQRIEALKERHNVLSILLFGSTEEKQELFKEESEPEVVVQKGTTRKAKAADPFDGLVKFLRSQPGSSRKEIEEFLALDEGVAKRLVEKAKRQRVIVNEGRGRASVWYLTEEK